MKAIILIVLALSGADPSPLIRPIDGRHEIALPASIKSALREFDPSFRLCAEADYPPLLVRFYEFSATNAPFATVGDFNGDSRVDVALHGMTSNSEVVVAVISSASGSYGARELQRFPKPPPNFCGETRNPECGLDTFLEAIPKGTHYSGVFEDHPLTLQHDALQVGIWNKAAILYYWESGEFRTYVTGD